MAIEVFHDARYISEVWNDHLGPQAAMSQKAADYDALLLKSPELQAVARAYVEAYRLGAAHAEKAWGSDALFPLLHPTAPVENAVAICSKVEEPAELPRRATCANLVRSSYGSLRLVAYGNTEDGDPLVLEVERHAETLGPPAQAYVGHHRKRYAELQAAAKAVAAAKMDAGARSRKLIDLVGQTKSELTSICGAGF